MRGRCAYTIVGRLGDGDGCAEIGGGFGLRLSRELGAELPHPIVFFEIQPSIVFSSRPQVDGVVPIESFRPWDGTNRQLSPRPKVAVVERESGARSKSFTAIRMNFIRPYRGAHLGGDALVFIRQA